MTVTPLVLNALDHALHLQGRAQRFTPETPLLGHLPELDSMAVVALLTTLEDRLGIAFDDADIDGSAFATVGSLCALVEHTRRAA